MKKAAITAILLLAMFTLHAQAFTLKGTVVDEAGAPLEFVTVVLKGPKTIGALTDLHGKFSITLPDTAQQNNLEFTYPDYQPLTYKVRYNDRDIKIQMKLESVQLTDVVITTDLPRFENGTTGDLTVIDHRSSPRRKARPSGRSHSESGADSKIRAGTLTAGEVNDFAKWQLWGNILRKDFVLHTTTWGFQPIHRYIAQLTNLQGMPIANAKVTLKRGQDALWLAKTDNTGKAELWLNFFDAKANSDSTDLWLEFEHEGKTKKITQATTFEKGINATQIDVACKKPAKVDLFFMVDATGSMSDELWYLKAELDNIVKEIQKQQSELKLRVGSGVYRDRGDEYVTRQTPLDRDLQPTLKFLANQSAGGGGDAPEAVDMALVESIANQDWDGEAVARILFIVLDAPSHTDPEVIARLRAQIELAAAKGIRVVPIACSDIQKDGEYLMRTIALATNGTYLFLTDDSGIGNAHIKPTTDKYEVEKLNAAVVRIVKQYTQMPECDNSRIQQEAESANSSDQFVPNPYDENPSEKPNDLSASDILQVSPNPCNNTLKIKLLKKDVKDVFLVDMTGKMLFGFDFVTREGFAELDVRALAKGIYFVKAFYEGRWFTVKVLKAN